MISAGLSVSVTARARNTVNMRWADNGFLDRPKDDDLEVWLRVEPMTVRTPFSVKAKSQ